MARPRAVDQALGGAIREAIADGDLRGKKGEIALFYPRGAIPARRVLVVGLGPQDKFTPADRCAGHPPRRPERPASWASARSAALSMARARGAWRSDAAAQAVVEGTILGLYRYQELKNEPPDRPDPEQLTLVQFDAAKLPAVETGAQVGQIVAEAACLARDLVNRPANYATPSRPGRPGHGDRRRVRVR